MKVHLSSVGCKLNQAELDILARRFILLGHQVVSSEREADLCVINTCTVTHVAARKSRQMIRSARRANPSARIAVTGCYAEMSSQEIKEIEGVDLVVGNEDKERLVELIERLEIRSYGLRDKHLPLSPTPYSLIPNRTRAFVKIQDGCDNACTYCIVTIARGRQRSRPAEEVLAEINDRVAAGYKEAVLTGVHIGAYGREVGTTLRDLVEEILTRTEVRRLRLSSIEPWDFDPALLPLWSDRRLCRHLHLPLQSGSDTVLTRMGRRYTAAQYARLVEMAREAIPDLAVTTDVMVGFPGESEAEFEESLRFVRGIGFARAHVFKYSPRPGTIAASMPQQVPYELKKARSDAMLELARQSSRHFCQGFIGRKMGVLWEKSKRRGDSAWSGLTDNYIRVRAESESNLANTITPTELVGLTTEGMWGKIILSGRDDDEPEREVDGRSKEVYERG